MKNFGFRVQMTLGAKFKNAKQTLRNVTEIHYNFDSPYERNRIAFESTIHQTGVVYRRKDIHEFEATLETEKAESF